MLITCLIGILSLSIFQEAAALHGLELDPFASPEDSNSAEGSGELLPGLCPDDWLEASVTYPTHKQKICILINKEAKSWEDARETCQDDYGFLINLSDGPIKISGLDVQEYLIQEGLRNVWTGIHAVDGQIQWDGIVPKAVPARDSTILGWEIESYDDESDINDLCGELNITTWHQQIVLKDVRNPPVNVTTPSTMDTTSTQWTDTTEAPPILPEIDSNGPTQSSPTTSMATFLNRLQKSLSQLSNVSQSLNKFRKALSQAQEEIATQSDNLPDSQPTVSDFLSTLLEEMNSGTGQTSAQIMDTVPVVRHDSESQQNGQPGLPNTLLGGSIQTQGSPKAVADTVSVNTTTEATTTGSPLPGLNSITQTVINPQPTLLANMQLLLSQLNQKLSASNETSSESSNGTHAANIANILALLNKTSEQPHPSSGITRKRRALLPDFRTRIQSFKLHFNKIKLQSCNSMSPSVCIRRPITIRQNVSTCAPHWVGDIFHRKCYKRISGQYTFSQATHKCKEYWSRVVGYSTSAFQSNVIIEAADAQDILAPQMQQFWVRIKGSKGSHGGHDDCKAVIGRDFRQESCSSSLNVMCEKNRENTYNVDSSAQDSSEVVKTTNDDDDSTGLVQVRLSYRDDNVLSCGLESSIKELPYIWYKDGMPTSSVWRTREFRLNQQLARRIERIIGEPITQPELQGVYQCKVWSQTPDMELLKSHKTLVTFTDVVTLIGEIGINGISPIVELYFNQLHRSMVIITNIERGLVSLNNHLTMMLSKMFPYIMNIKSRVSKILSRPGKVIFNTYIKTSRDVSVDESYSIYQSYFHSFSVSIIRDTVRKQSWDNLQNITKFIVVRSAVVCKARNITVPNTSISVPFPKGFLGTTVNSTKMCGDVPMGEAICAGDLSQEPQWEYVSVNATACGLYIPEIKETKTDSIVTSTGTTKIDLDQSQRSGDSSSEEKEHSEASHEVFQGDVEITEEDSNSVDEVLEIIHQKEIDDNNVEDILDEMADRLEEAHQISGDSIERIADIVEESLETTQINERFGRKMMRSISRLARVHKDEGSMLKNKTSVNRILKVVDQFADDVNLEGDDAISIVTPEVSLQVWKLQATAPKLVIGLAANVSIERDLEEKDFVPLHSRRQVDVKEYDVSIELPETLIKERVKQRDVKLSMTVFRHGNLFQVADKAAHMFSTTTSLGVLNSPIISASINGQRIQGLKDKVRVAFRPNKLVSKEVARTICAFWNFSLNGDHGGWSGEGCAYNGTSHGKDICLCNHLTNFAILLDFYGQSNPIGKDHETALTVVSIVGLSLSIIGLCLTILSFLLFEKLRRGRGQKTIFNLAIAMLFSWVVFIAGIQQTQHRAGCLAVAALLHYFILASFMWMLMQAILQYLTFVKVFGTHFSKYMLKTVIVAWGVPVIPVSIVSAYDYNLYMGGHKYCWMSLDAFYYSFALPIGLIIMANLILFIIVVISITRRAPGLRSNQSARKKAMMNLQASISSFVLIGLTWIFGYLAIEDARLVFPYIFTITNTLQGFFMFVLLILRKKKVRQQWIYLCCKKTPLQNSGTLSNTSSNYFQSTLRSTKKSIVTKTDTLGFDNHGYNDFGKR